MADDKLAATAVTEDQAKKGLEFILSHFHTPLFPRKIMTKALGYQVEVFDRQQTLTEFKKSNFIDCRISAFKSYTNFKGINRTPANFIMIDLDLKDFGFDKGKLDKTLTKTLKKIKEVVGGAPTVLWTGNGYHIYQPINGFILEEIDVFAEFVENGNNYHKDLTSSFMQFAEGFFTNKKSDLQHNASIKSCLLRIPYTFNSKCIKENKNEYEKAQVKVIQCWNGYRPPINYLLRDFRRYLINEKVKELQGIQKRKERENKHWLSISNTTTISWIERLLRTPLNDNRKFVIWRILAPYLLNVKKLSPEQCSDIINDWLHECNKLVKLDFNVNQKIKEGLKCASNGYFPIGLEDLKSANPILYSILEK
jgi:hypothetical protein